MTSRHVSALFWAVIHTQPAKEHIASRFIRGLGHETLFLRYRAQTRHARKVTEVVRPYFPGYIFVGLEGPQGLYSVNNAFGVSSAVYCGDRPLQVPQNVMEELFARAGPDGYVDGVDRQEQRRRLETGQAVRVDGGPFQGFVGQVELDTGAEIKVWLQSLNHRMRVTFTPEALSPA